MRAHRHKRVQDKLHVMGKGVHLFTQVHTVLSMIQGDCVQQPAFNVCVKVSPGQWWKNYKAEGRIIQ